MNMLKRAQESGEYVVVVGATGPGKMTNADPLGDLAAHRIIVAPTRAGMGVDPIFSQVLDLATKPKR